MIRPLDYKNPFDIADLQKIRELAAESSEKHRSELEKIKRDANRRRQKQSTKPNPFKTGEKPPNGYNSGVVISYDPVSDRYSLLTDEGKVLAESLTNGNVKIGAKVATYRVGDKIYIKVPPVNKKKSSSPNRNQDNPYIGKGVAPRRPVRRAKVKIRIGVTAGDPTITSSTG